MPHSLQAGGSSDSMSTAPAGAPAKRQHGAGLGQGTTKAPPKKKAKVAGGKTPRFPAGEWPKCDAENAK